MKDEKPKKKVLFKSGPNGPVYRIPSLLYIEQEKKKTFLAFAERRKNADDASAEYLVMRKGVWENGSVKWGKVEELKGIGMKNNRTMNPCPVYDKETKELFLFFNCIPEGVSESDMKTWGNQSKMCYVTSRDYGKTWSRVKNITGATIDINKLATVFVAPGHGIQTRHLECWDLIIPAYVYVAGSWDTQLKGVKAHSFYLYSKDHGNSWRVSERIICYETGECELAEITGNHGELMLYCNARSTCGKRIEAQAEIGGTFASANESTTLPEYGGGCMGSVVSFPGKGQEGTHRLLYSHPTKEERNDLGIYLNRMDSKPWSDPKIIYEGPSAYSDLAYCQGTDTVAILFECGKKTPYEEIGFCSLPLNDVLSACSTTAV
ncbi:sialidase-4 [Xenopus tropicalis]|uniref:exo-alpha-sialidase n=2 Tax=Xenopus tropicalis TaxID=8364 RepID=A0A1B8Y474_XENTR|nr:sialidase-4 [Xenopus tropicalis]|eukprot:XP_002942456.2 PREDICTED: sialidase-4 [Xenopus tropicalis]